ncbi:hypothetical protein GDO81_020813 [Engystomops pustulosus]|uniref:Uncharacterized protein n=1 Tax=Engystomops pustulosus TaxID=76066 RepID=A0AAV6YQ22_ENGPU|nr:hypothetical protein GDO81_020813 [Engystomops pustulosus]
MGASKIDEPTPHPPDMKGLWGPSAIRPLVIDPSNPHIGLSLAGPLRPITEHWRTFWYFVMGQCCPLLWLWLDMNVYFSEQRVGVVHILSLCAFCNLCRFSSFNVNIYITLHCADNPHSYQIKTFGGCLSLDGSLGQF